MRFDPSAKPSEFAAIFRKFILITGWSVWKTRLSSLREQVEKTPLIEEYFKDVFPLELEVEKMHKNILLGRKPRMPETYDEYSVMSFIFMTVGIYERLSNSGKNRLSGMIRSGLKADDGLASLKHEVGIATHLMKEGFDVNFSDIEATDRFDLLASKEGVEIEVECKNFSADVGRKIHRRRLYQLGGVLYPLMMRALDRRDGGQFLQIRIPKRLEGADKQLIDIGESTESALAHGVSVVSSKNVAINYSTFSLVDGPFQHMKSGEISREETQKYLQRKLGVSINHALIVFRPGHGLIVVKVESAQSDEVMSGFVRRLKTLAKGQISGQRPALICVRLSDVTEDELVELANEDNAGRPSSLQLATNMLLNRVDWKPVHTIAYFVPGRIFVSSQIQGQLAESMRQERGRPYVFSNPNNELASDSRLNIF